MLRSIIILGCALLAAACAADQAPPETSETPENPAIPERPFAVPTGPHAIGMTEYRWTDADRPEPFTRDPDDLRSVAVRVWYPAAESAGAGDAMYLPDPAEFGDAEDFVAVTHVRTNAIADAAPAAGPFPVLVYHHGGGWTRFTSTFTTEELASHGYVVVSVGHNGFNRTQFLPDGASVAPDTLTFPEPTGDLLADALGSWDYLDDHHFPEWVADARFVLDQLETLNGSGLFAGRLDLDRIGMYGWSFGGATSIEASVVDERVKAAIDHDGQLFGTAPTAGTARPFMLMHGGELPELPPTDDPEVDAANEKALAELMAQVTRTDSALKAASTGDWYDVTIAGTNHGSFSDLVLFTPAFAASIETVRGHEIVNALTLAFFDRYLKGADAPLLDDPAAVYPEVEMEARR